jgi:hypothetical protein
MPRIPCPACKSEVKYSRDAEPGTELKCPNCDEVFVPPELKEKGYDPNKDEVYRAEKPIDDPDAEMKNKKVAAATYHAARRAREQSQPRKTAWYEGPELWLLIFGIGALGGAPFGFWLARNWDKMGPGKFFWLMLGLCLVAIVMLSLAMSSWAWLRKNR